MNGILSLEALTTARPVHLITQTVPVRAALHSLLVFLLIYSSIDPSLCLVVWNEGTEAELEWGEMLVAGNYSLSLIDFSPEESDVLQALVELQKDNVTLATRSLHEGDSFILNDSVKVTAERIVRDEEEDEQYADLLIQLPAEPEIALLLSADKEIYRGGDTIRMELGIENKGIVDAEGMQIIIDSKPQQFLEKFSRSILDAGRTWDEKKHTAELDPIKFDLKAPYLAMPEEFQLRVFCTFEDPDGKKHEAWGGTKFQVAGSLQLHKRVEESQDYGKGYYVTDSFWNCGNRTINIELDDSTGSDFVANETLHWQVKLAPGQTKTESYEIFAGKPGTGLILPPAQATFALGGSDCTVTSESPMVDVFGPFIEAKRDIDKRSVSPGSVVTVTLNLTNSGNKKAKVSYRETVPEGAFLERGKTCGWVLLDPSGGVDEEYTIRCTNPGRLRLPASEISYHDAMGNSYHAGTQEVEINVAAPKAIRTPPRNASLNASLNASGATEAGAVKEKAESEDNFIVYLSLLIVLIFGAFFARYS